jgi:hypothetical protein
MKPVHAGSNKENTMSLLEKFSKFCGVPVAPEVPLRLRPGLAPLILADKRYLGVPTEDLVGRARKRLKSTPADRAVAIAILQGA